MAGSPQESDEKMVLTSKCDNISVSLSGSQVTQNESVEAEIVSLNHTYPQMKLRCLGQNLRIQSVFPCLTVFESNSTVNFIAEDGSVLTNDGTSPCIVVYSLVTKSPQFVIVPPSHSALSSDQNSSGSNSVMDSPVKEGSVKRSSSFRRSSIIANLFSYDPESIVYATPNVVERKLTPEDIMKDKSPSQSGLDETELLKKFEKISLQADELSNRAEESPPSPDSIEMLPPLLRIDWNKVQNRLKQIVQEIIGEIESIKTANIQRMIQEETDRANQKRAKVSSLLVSIEESLSLLPRSVTRPPSVSDSVVSFKSGRRNSGGIVTAAATTSTSSSVSGISSNPLSSSFFSRQASSDMFRSTDVLCGGSNEHLFSLDDGADRDEYDDDDLEDVNEKDEGVVSSDEEEAGDRDDDLFEDEEEDEDFGDSGGSSSGIENNASTITAADAEAWTRKIRSKTMSVSASYGRKKNGQKRHNTNPEQDMAYSYNPSEPICIGSFSQRSASVAIDDDADDDDDGQARGANKRGSGNKFSDGGDVHTKMRELSRSVRADSSGIFGDRPDEHRRRVDFSQVMRSYTSSTNHGILMYEMERNKNNQQEETS